MPLTKYIGLGFLIAVDPTGGTTFTPLGTVVDGISGPDAKADEVDCTLLSEVVKDYRKSTVDPGNVSFTVAYDPGFSETHVLANLLNSNVVANWRITFPDMGAGVKLETFKGFLGGMGREIKRDSMVTSAITIRVCGSPGFTLVPPV